MCFFYKSNERWFKKTVVLTKPEFSFAKIAINNDSDDNKV